VTALTALIGRWVAPYAKFITAGVGLLGLFLVPEDVDYIVAVLTALGVFAVPNR
jgi:hypothetical protein